MTLHLSLQAEPFEYDVPEDEDEHLSITPGVDTQWLEVPVSIFIDRNVLSLDGLSIVYEGPRSINALTGEEWRDTPGLLGTYGDEAFRRVRIDVTHREGPRFALHLVGETEAGTIFDVACEAPLGVSLTSSTGQAGEDRLRRWFDTFLQWEHFAWERRVYRTRSMSAHAAFYFRKIQIWGGTRQLLADLAGEVQLTDHRTRRGPAHATNGPRATDGEPPCARH